MKGDMENIPPAVSSPREAFTLLEMLISLVLLVLLAIMIFQITSATSGTIRFSNRSIDAAAQARLSFDRIGMDLANLVKDGQTDFATTNAAPGTNNLLEFVSLVTSSGTTSGGNRGVSIVAYQVNTHPDNKNRLGLERAAKPVGWNTAGFRGLQANGVPMSFANPSFPASLLPSSTSSPSDYDVLAPGVIRMLVGYQLYPDDLSAELQDGTVIQNARGQIVYSPPIRRVTATDGSGVVKLVDLTRVSAIVVGLVSIDLETLKLLDAGSVKSLSDAFSGIPSTNQLPLAKWMMDTGDLSSLPASIPLPARQSVRVYQRTFPITPFTSRDS
jgi:competence protein ComGC